jgi:light-regulated signal transduction histidine kinase (bacteriophytochrome)
MSFPQACTCPDLLQHAHDNDVLRPLLRAWEFIHFVVDGGMRMKALFDDLLEYSRIDNNNKIASVDRIEVMVSVLRGLRLSIADSEADMIVERMPIIMADESQMAQVMQNLVGNAIKFHGRERPIVHVSVNEQGEDWVFSVKDNGIGLNTAYADKIFQMFQRLNNRD